MKLRCLIVDDEPPAHKILECYISKMDGLELVHNCYNAFDAFKVIRNETIDLLFLDINMPELSGLEFLKTLKHKPAVILTTAYSEYALESYEFGVKDYLLKPIRLDRFIQAIHKVQDSISTNSEQKPIVKSEPLGTSFFVKVDGVKHNIKIEEILYVESKGNFVQIHFEDKKILTASTLTKMEQKLKPHSFLRIHKSFVINKNKLEAIHGNQIAIHNAKLPIGNSYRQIVLKEIGG